MMYGPVARQVLDARDRDARASSSRITRRHAEQERRRKRPALEQLAEHRIVVRRQIAQHARPTIVGRRPPQLAVDRSPGRTASISWPTVKIWCACSSATRTPKRCSSSVRSSTRSIESRPEIELEVRVGRDRRPLRAPRDDRRRRRARARSSAHCVAVPAPLRRRPRLLRAASAAAAARSRAASACPSSSAAAARTRSRSPARACAAAGEPTALPSRTAAGRRR